MQTQNRILDDFAKLLTSAAGAAQGARKEIETIMRQQADKLIAEFDLVSREDFDAVRAMAVKAREENEMLIMRVEALEAALHGSKQRSSSKTRKAPKRKTSTPKKQGS